MQQFTTGQQIRNSPIIHVQVALGSGGRGAPDTTSITDYGNYFQYIIIVGNLHLYRLDNLLNAFCKVCKHIFQYIPLQLKKLNQVQNFISQ